MFNKRTLRYAVVFALFSVTAIACHAQEVLRIDPPASEVHFTLGAAMHTVHGTFLVTEGTLQVRRAAGEMTGNIAVAAATGDSGNGSRDSRMKDSELRVQQYPQVTFQPQRFTGTLAPSGKSNIVVSGVFTLLGTGHNINVPMHVEATGDRYTATGSFSIPYVAWGLKDPSTFILRVGKEVLIDLKLAATLQH